LFLLNIKLNHYRLEVDRFENNRMKFFYKKSENVIANLPAGLPAARVPPVAFLIAVAITKAIAEAQDKAKAGKAGGVKQSLFETASCLAVTVKVFLETASLALRRKPACRRGRVSTKDGGQ